MIDREADFFELTYHLNLMSAHWLPYYFMNDFCMNDGHLNNAFMLEATMQALTVHNRYAVSFVEENSLVTNDMYWLIPPLDQDGNLLLYNEAGDILKSHPLRS